MVYNDFTGTYTKLIYIMEIKQEIQKKFFAMLKRKSIKHWKKML